MAANTKSAGPMCAIGVTGPTVGAELAAGIAHPTLASVSGACSMIWRVNPIGVRTRKMSNAARKRLTGIKRFLSLRRVARRAPRPVVQVMSPIWESANIAGAVPAPPVR